MPDLFEKQDNLSRHGLSRRYIAHRLDEAIAHLDKNELKTGPARRLLEELRRELAP